MLKVSRTEGYKFIQSGCYCHANLSDVFPSIEPTLSVQLGKEPVPNTATSVPLQSLGSTLLIHT